MGGGGASRGRLGGGGDVAATEAVDQVETRDLRGANRAVFVDGGDEGAVAGGHAAEGVVRTPHTVGGTPLFLKFAKSGRFFQKNRKKMTRFFFKKKRPENVKKKKKKNWKKSANFSKKVEKKCQIRAKKTRFLGLVHKNVI